MRTDHDDISSNPSGNRPFQDVVATRFSRRTMLTGSLAVAAGFFAACSDDDDDTTGSDTSSTTTESDTDQADAATAALIGFTPIALGGLDNEVEIADGYTAVPFAAFGDPLVPSGPAYEGRATSAAATEAQIGGGHDGMYFAAIDDANDHGVLIFNNEYTTDGLLFAEGDDATTEENIRKSQYTHGCTVIEIRNGDDGWEVVESDLARNIHANSPMTFDGPAADDPRLDTGAEPQGTLGNCGNGVTLWGTYLTAEENFDGFFGWDEAAGEFTPDEIDKRLGLGAESYYQWWTGDARFDLARTPNEIKRFGWIVEIDPTDASSTPVKHTALGRFKHEAAEMAETGDGRVAVYMGDDQRGDYLYKFVSDRAWQEAIDAGESPLAAGTLHVAVFDDDGSGRWVPLTPDTSELADLDLPTILLGARNAADLVGATPMDRPEWASVAPDGQVYVCLTNNSDRTEANGPNPRVPNEGGQILRIDDGDHAGTDFTWDLFLLGWDPTIDDGATELPEDAAFSSPDGLYIDPDGRVFIATDGDQKDDANNQLLVADAETGEVFRLMNGPAGCEVTGFAHTPDRSTLFVNIQHPGGDDGDASVSTFPYGGDIARHAVVAITKTDGGVVGS